MKHAPASVSRPWRVEFLRRGNWWAWDSYGSSVAALRAGVAAVRLNPWFRTFRVLEESR